MTYWSTAKLTAALLFVGCVISIASAAPKKSKLVDKFKICHPKEKEFQKCFKSSFEDALAFIAKGSREFNIVPLEPLHVPKLHVGDSNGPVGFGLTFDRCDIHGLSNLKDVSAKADLEKNTFEIVLTVPHIIITGKYHIDGRILLLPIRGQGDINMTCDNPVIEWKIMGKLIEKAGKTYFDVQNFKLHHKIPGGSIHLSNLFDGDERLGETMNRFLNENFNEVLGILLKDFDETMGEVMKGLAKRIFDQLPYNEIFPNA
ncbi:protein takeout-like [Ischnura elegans]|uniref:protein takeout-like n=1 Tax=Ischnura elegans TaxID=197161 RepID=UPI001ED88FE2|nr:protein takeout-like [Ischnura elegans]